MLHAVDLMPQDILAEIGKIIAWWGYIQFQLGVIIREIAEIPKRKSPKTSAGRVSPKARPSFLIELLR